jgi:hypothetical protein
VARAIVEWVGLQSVTLVPHTLSLSAHVGLVVTHLLGVTSSDSFV